MKRFYALILLVALSLPMTGCFHNQILVEPNYNSGATQADWHNGWQLYALAGLIPLGQNPIDLATICPQGVGLVETKMSFVNGLVSALLAGGAIISFQDLRITCANTPVAALDAK